MARTRSDSPPLFELPLRPDFTVEAGLMRKGSAPVAGLDEAGRGPLAGPVVAAAVILDPERIPDGLDDSKRLDHGAREALFETLCRTARSMSVASMCASAIDCSDIRRASLEAMRRALAGLCLPAAFALVDGRDVPPGLACPGRALIKGDRRSQSVAAASIMAKVTRDRMMARFARSDPRYGFEAHVGYATARHREAIAAHGPVLRLHRMTFAPFRTDAEDGAGSPAELEIGLEG